MQQGSRRRRSPSALSLDDVRKSGQLAFFHAFGDDLVYLHGTVYCVPSQAESRDPGELVRQPDAYPVTTVAGIEFGWHHLEGCDCDLCHHSRSSDKEIKVRDLERHEPAERSDVSVVDLRIQASGAEVIAELEGSVGAEAINPG